jgi:hypothetical protein
VSVSSVGGISVTIPDPAFYSSGNLPAGLDPASSPASTTASTASTTASTGSTASTNASAIQNEYNLLNTDDTEELLYASFLTPDQGLANADDVLAQAAELQDEQLSTQQQSLLANADADVTGTSLTSSSTPATDVSNLPSLSDLLSQSDSDAQAALTAFANAPAGSSIIDYQA